jgi:hypothetical protein
LIGLKPGQMASDKPKQDRLPFTVVVQFARTP